MTPDEQIKKKLAAWGPIAIALLKKYGYFNLDREEIQPDEALAELGSRFSSEVRKESLKKNREVWPLVWSAISAVAFASGVSSVARQIGVPQSAYDWNPRAQKFYDNHGDFFIKTLTNTDIQSLHQRIQQDFNLNPKDFGKKFANSYCCSPSRLERIKRAEGHMATQGGSWNFAEEADCQYKQWMCTARGRWPRPSHRANWYQVRALDAPFDNGEIYPGAINCRCYLLYFIDRDHLKWGAKRAG